MSGLTSMEVFAKVRQLASLKPSDLTDKKVLVRVDFNCPLLLGSGGQPTTVASDSRIRAALPTIQYLIDAKAKVILVSHLGRPKGRDPELSLRPVAGRLRELLHPCPVAFVDDCVGPEVRAAANALDAGTVLLLENTRFHAGEQANDAAFAAELAAVAEVYCNDAFGTAHRSEASVDAVPRLFGTRVAGLLMSLELSFLGPAVNAPARPFCLVLGGAKISSKLPLLRSMMSKCDKILVGGGMAFTFLRAAGFGVGKSLVEESLVQTARDIIQLAEQAAVELVLPRDVVVTHSLYKDATPTPPSAQPVPVVTSPSASSDVVLVDDIPDDMMGVDVGPATLRAFCAELETCKTVLWNGPVGVCEVKPYGHGTAVLMEFIAALTTQGCCTIVGGADTVAALENNGILNFTHISTGGGAALELLEGKLLPGLLALME